MKKTCSALLLSLFLLLGAASIAFAATGTVGITQYDILNTVEDRTGDNDGHSAAYTGSVTNNPTTGRWFYRGGVGSLNNGDTYEGVNEGQQLFQGGIGTTMELFFDTDFYYSIIGLRIYGGDPSLLGGFLNDTQTGALTQLSISGYDYLGSADVTASGLYTTPEHLVVSISGDSSYVDDYVDLSGIFGGKAVQSLTLSEFVAADGYQNGFSFSEIEVYGEKIEIPGQDDPTAPVPEPSALLLTGLGIVGLLALRRCRRAVRD
ncbi:PEP-CTERM sorting domain-containing protein [Pseudodesulfovibrio cashew]|nr:PEP-CTERM sorting domain-containing protein [Pseudodesulfovibrio cashew]